MVAEGEWPECWRIHWIHPIFKSGAVSNPEKYRGVHLTCILSKAIDRVVAVNFAGFVRSTQIYGQSQWAFRQNHSCRGLIALAVARWIRALYKNERVGIYLIDISAAFDRVPTPVLLENISSVGVSPEMLLLFYMFPNSMHEPPLRVNLWASFDARGHIHMIHALHKSRNKNNLRFRMITLHITAASLLSANLGSGDSLSEALPEEKVFQPI